MLPVSLAEVSVFGATMLDAIEWAMHPDESRRPQTVELFRAAIQGSESIAGNVDHPQQRNMFLQTLKRALPRRQH